MIFFEKIPLIFDIENWRWKYNFGTFWQTIIHRRFPCRLLGKNLAFQDPPSYKFHNRTDINRGGNWEISVFLSNFVCRLIKLEKMYKEIDLGEYYLLIDFLISMSKNKVASKPRNSLNRNMYKANYVKRLFLLSF